MYLYFLHFLHYENSSNSIKQNCQVLKTWFHSSVLTKRGKLISMLIGLLSSRPNRTSLRETGIVKERLFGCDLGEHLLNSGENGEICLSLSLEFR